MIVYRYIYINCSKKGVSLSRDANGQLFFEVVRVLEVRKKRVEKPFLRRHFVLKPMYHFTKTGSGQT
jgi:hypothetical protein